MKKLLAFMFVYCAVVLPSLSAITPEELTSEKYIQNHGYSEEMSRLIDLQNAQINGVKSNYVSKDPAWYSIKPVKFVRGIYTYFDCGLDDGKFMQHDIKYTNRYDSL